MSRATKAANKDLEEFTQAFIGDRLDKILDALYDLATGHWVEEVTNEGERRVYRKSPDFRAAQYLTDRQLGRPTERSESHNVNEHFDYASAMQARRDEYRASLSTKVVDGEFKALPEGEKQIDKAVASDNAALISALKARRTDV